MVTGAAVFSSGYVGHTRVVSRRVFSSLGRTVHLLGDTLPACCNLMLRVAVPMCFCFCFPPSAAQGTEIIKTNLKLNVFGVKLNSFFYHSYFPSASSMTWTLDYTKKSTLGKCALFFARRICVLRSVSFFSCIVVVFHQVSDIPHRVGGKIYTRFHNMTRARAATRHFCFRLRACFRLRRSVSGRR